MKVEEEFHITFSNAEATRIVTVGEFRDAIVGKLPSRSFTPEYVFDRVRWILIDHFGVAPEEIKLTARIVRDLGLD